MRKLLIIGAGTCQIAGIRRAQALGFSVLAVDGDAHAPGLALADSAFVADLRDSGAIARRAKAEGVQGVFSVSVEAAVRTAAAVAGRLGLPGLTREAAENATNKQRMREAWKAAGIPSPLSVPCATAEEAHVAASRLGLPVVVKPVDSAGSRGVSYINTDSSLDFAYTEARRHSATGTVLVEEFMPGVEMSVEAFVDHGQFVPLACSDKIRTSPPYLLDVAVLFPSEQPAAIQAEALRIVARAAAALGIDSAPLHAEVMITPNGPMMVELAARGPGFKVFTEMIPWVTGIDVVAETIRIALGEKRGVPPPRRRGAVLRFPEAAPGRVTRITGVADARGVPGIAELEIYCCVGDAVRPLRCGADRIGHIIALAETRSEALARAREAEAKVHIETQGP